MRQICRRLWEETGRNFSQENTVKASSSRPARTMSCTQKCDRCIPESNAASSNDVSLHNAWKASDELAERIAERGGARRDAELRTMCLARLHGFGRTRMVDDHLVRNCVKPKVNKLCRGRHV